MKKKFLALVLTLAMVLSLVPVTALAGNASLLSIKPDEGSFATYEFYKIKDDTSSLWYTQTVKKGDTLNRPADPTRTGYYFTGWKTADGAEVPFDTEVNVTETSTIQCYAQWEKNANPIHVYFMAAEGSKEVVYTGVAKDETVDIPEDYKDITWKTADGKAFEGKNVTNDMNVYPASASCWLTFDSQGGSAIASHYVQQGNAFDLSKVNPTKAGYAFAGWSLTTDGETVAQVTPTQDTKLFARWTPAAADYTVIHWQENANDEGYSYIASEKESGTTGDQTNAVAKSYQGFTATEIEQQTIKGDGSTIVNVYYQRNSYTIHFYYREYGSWEEYTDIRITAKHGADISSQWPEIKGSKTWSTNEKTGVLGSLKGPFQVNIQTMPLGGAKYYGPKTDRGSESAHYYVEVIPGESGTVTRGDVTYKLHHTDTSPGTGYEVTDEDKYELTGFNYKEGTRNGRSYDNAEFYYTRNSYNVVYFSNGVEVKKEPYKYEQDISGAGNYKPDNAPDGYEFGGWYSDPIGTKKYDFSGKKMPAQHITVYAKWVPITLKLTIQDVNGVGSGDVNYKQVINEAGVYQQAMDKLAEANKTVLYWVTSTGERVDVSSQMTKDLTIRPVLKGDTYTVTYSGDATTTKDPYAYWHGTTAKVQDYTGDNIDKFLYWTDAANTTTKYHPGDEIRMTANVTLKPHFSEGNPVQQTYSVTYHSNFGTDQKCTPEESIENNALFTIKAYKDTQLPNQEGYEFTDWNTKPDGTGEKFEANSTARMNGDNDNDLYAQWQPCTYTLTYNANGGYFSSVENTTTTEGMITAGKHDLLYTPAYTPNHEQTSEGKDVIFLGWSTTQKNKVFSKSDVSDATTIASSITTKVDIPSVQTVYAVWSLDENNNDIPDVFEATIIYKIENGKWTKDGKAIGSADITATFQLYEQQADHTWKATNKLLRDGNFPAGYTGNKGYTGLGWYRNSETTPSPSELVRPTTEVIKAVTGAQTVFTYKYAPTTSKTYTVVLHLEGGSYATTSTTYTKNSDGIYQYSVTQTNAAINPESPSRNNFSFEGWSLSKSAPQTLIGKDATFASLYLEQSGMSGSFDKIDLYAVWKESEPSVTVNKKVETVGGKPFERDKTVARQNDKIVWSVTVTNGKDTPAQVTLTDVMAAGVYTDVGCQTEASAVNWNATAHSWTATVSPKGSSIYYVCYTVTQDDIPNGKIVNTIVKGDDKDHPINSDPVSTWDTKQLKSATSLSTSDWTTTVTLTLPTVNKATDNNTVNPVVISKGSYVIDKIGNEFTFVPELKLTLKVGDTDTTYTGEKVENTDTYNFGTKVGEEYPYTVTYTAKNDETQTPAQFKWEINQDIPAGTTVTLSYKLKLTTPKTATGTYGVTDLDGNGFVDGAETTKVVAADALYTNESAALYKNADTKLAEFPKPSVSYTIKGSSGGHGGNGGGTVTIPDDVPTGLNGKDHYAYVVGYPDGMVYPQKNITRAEVATIFFRLLKDETREANMTKSNSYNDMKDGAWYTCAVSTLSKMGIIKGYEDGSFKPGASISRAEFAAIAARFDPDGDKTPATFSDVSSHWAKDEISIAANHGWIKGYEDGSFKPDQKITRAETMTLVNRVLKRLPETKDDLHKDMKTWPDNQNESAWFYLAVQEATNSHYQKLKKDGTHETWESMRETRDWAALEK